MKTENKQKLIFLPKKLILEYIKEKNRIISFKKPIRKLKTETE
jgi:hypothetical protein